MKKLQQGWSLAGIIGLVLVVVPSHAFAQTLRALAPWRDVATRQPAEALG